ncbi:MAG: ArsI/CadI family heavy metal resistance metalloenzyme [Leptospiraceae bacterium]|nr:ArsI/CadI family heavy metal resistance metalloenzyme [Leptospiraceae bacterium]
MSYPRTHISLYVSDIEKSKEFYERFFQRKAVKLKEDYAKFILDEPSLIISFVENPEKVNPSFGHLGFQVETKEELQAKLEEFKASQFELREEMDINCCYAYQDKFWVEDPDGHQWEIYYFHADSEFSDPRFQESTAQACCIPKKEIIPKLDFLKPAACIADSGCC